MEHEPTEGDVEDIIHRDDNVDQTPDNLDFLNFMMEVNESVSTSKFDFLLTDGMIGQVHTGKIPVTFLTYDSRKYLTFSNMTHCIQGIQVYCPAMRNALCLPQRGQIYENAAKLPVLLSAILAYGSLIHVNVDKLLPSLEECGHIYKKLKSTLRLSGWKMEGMADVCVRIEGMFVMKGVGDSVQATPLWPTKSRMDFFSFLCLVKQEELTTYYVNTARHLMYPLEELLNLPDNELKKPETLVRIMLLPSPLKATILYHAELVVQAYCSHKPSLGLILTSLKSRTDVTSIYRIPSTCYTGNSELYPEDNVVGSFKRIDPNIIPLLDYERVDSNSLSPSEVIKTQVVARTLSKCVRQSNDFVNCMTDILHIFLRYAYCRNMQEAETEEEIKWHPESELEAPPQSIFDSVPTARLVGLSALARKKMIINVCKLIVRLYQHACAHLFLSSAKGKRFPRRLGWSSRDGPPTSTMFLQEIIANLGGDAAMNGGTGCLHSFAQSQLPVQNANSFFSMLVHSCETRNEERNVDSHFRNSWGKCPVRRVVSIVMNQFNDCRELLRLPNSMNYSDPTAWTQGELEVILFQTFIDQRCGGGRNDYAILWRTTPSDQRRYIFSAVLVIDLSIMTFRGVTGPLRAAFRGNRVTLLRDAADLNQRQTTRGRRDAPVVGGEGGGGTRAVLHEQNPINMPPIPADLTSLSTHTWCFGDHMRSRDVFWSMFKEGNGNHPNSYFFTRFVLKCFMKVFHGLFPLHP